MLNKFSLQGEVLEIKTSGNHSFGILLLKINNVNIGNFKDTILNEGIFPYKVKDGNAEVYGGIPDGIQKWDKVIVHSDKKRIYYHYVIGNRTYEGYTGIIIDPYDILYVKENTLFK